MNNSFENRFSELNKNGSAFCILPWVQYYVNEVGKILPCGHATSKFPLGWYEWQPTEAILNSQNFKILRSNFINQIKQESLCDACYFKEANGVKSPRQYSNERFKTITSDLIDSTKSDGELKAPKLRSWEIRFSNLCNFRCLMCDPTSSSSWANSRGVKINPLLFYEEEKFEEFSRFIPYVQYINFLGGEPLLTEKHYQLLDRLIKENRTDIQISYNTNMSRLGFGSWNVLELWKHFPNLVVLASLDETGERAEYLRRGTS